MTAHRSIVVGIDGSPSSLEAVSWAARKAVLRDAPLTLITTMFVPGVYGVPIGMSPSFFEEEELDGKKRLAQAQDVARTVAGDHQLTVDTELCTGSPVGELLERAKTARLVVVGANRRGLLERAFPGSVSRGRHPRAHPRHSRAGPAAHRDQRCRRARRGRGRRVGTQRASDHQAFEEAALRGVDLVAVHAWSDVDVWVPFEGDPDTEWAKLVTNEIALPPESLAGRAEQYADVTVWPVVVRDEPTRNLREQAEHSQLLVVGSRGRAGSRVCCWARPAARCCTP